MKRISILVFCLFARMLVAQVGGVIFGPSTQADYAEREARMRSLETSVAANPDGAMPIRSLALAYAEAVNEGSPLRAHALSALDASRNVWLLSNTAYSLQSLYNQGLQRGETKPELAKLADQYFERAKALDPNLDRAAILPQIDLEQIRLEREAEQRVWAARFEQAASTIRRLPVEAFPQVPATVAGVLRSRKCEVPQVPNRSPHNVIRGEFFGRGQSGWAVLCSVGGTSTLLVFRSDVDTSPVALATSEDKNYLQGGVNTVDFSRGIEVADRDYIVRHAQPGEPKPALDIDHVGIDDAFLGKGSTIWYFERGQWLQLPGAD